MSLLETRRCAKCAKPRVLYCRNPMSPIYLLWDSSCKLIIYCGTHPPEFIKYRPISHMGYGIQVLCTLSSFFHTAPPDNGPTSLFHRVDLEYVYWQTYAGALVLLCHMNKAHVTLSHVTKSHVLCSTMSHFKDLDSLLDDFN